MDTIKYNKIQMYGVGQLPDPALFPKPNMWL